MSDRTVLVGNAPLGGCIASLVDGAARVIRFNRARGHGAESGSRTDELYLINHGGQMAEWLERDELPRLAAIGDGVTVVLPIPMLPGHLPAPRPHEPAPDPDRVNHLEVARRRLERAGRRVESVSLAEYRAVQRALATVGGRWRDHHPSTGFVALFRTLLGADEDGRRVELCGFTFEGWRGHSWEAERRWVGARAAEGRLTVHPVR